ncbi:MAG: transcription antitermination factor NusB [Candidatus Dormibacteria bacterium]
MTASPSSRRGARSTGRRHRGREVALRVTFELEGRDTDAASALAYQCEDMHVTGDIAGFADVLVRGLLESRPEVDAAIAEASTHWDLDNLGKVERAVLRLATYELLCAPDTPAAVIIDEAVELAKTYAGQEAAGFVNGVLGHVATGPTVAIRPDGDSRRGAARAGGGALGGGARLSRRAPVPRLEGGGPGRLPAGEAG